MAGLPPIDKAQMSASFAKHRMQTDLSTDEYVRSRKIEWANVVTERKRIYLDLNYWIRLRDVELGRSHEPDMVRILSRLRVGVSSAKYICPISESTFIELFKQDDEGSRLATAALIDELSQGACLVPWHERMATEVAHFFHMSLGTDVLPIGKLVWSKLSYILGVTHPVTQGLSSDQQSLVQKAFLDYMWDISLTNMVPLLGAGFVQKQPLADTAEMLNALNAQHAPQGTRFKQVYEDEFVGGLELVAQAGTQVLEELEQQLREVARQPSAEERQHAERETFGLLRAAFDQRRDVVVKALPTVHIGALCQAAVRWDQKRKLTGNDLFDFHHAQAALPYCDVFLTEKPLHTLLGQKHVDALGQYPCRVISSTQEAADFLGAWSTATP